MTSRNRTRRQVLQTMALTATWLAGRSINIPRRGSSRTSAACWTNWTGKSTRWWSAPRSQPCGGGRQGHADGQALLLRKAAGPFRVRAVRRAVLVGFQHRGNGESGWSTWTTGGGNRSQADSWGHMSRNTAANLHHYARQDCPIRSLLIRWPIQFCKQVLADRNREYGFIEAHGHRRVAKTKQRPAGCLTPASGAGIVTSDGMMHRVIA